MIKTPAQSTLSFLAAALFFLAGVAWIIASLMLRPGHHAATFTAIGAMFLCVGCLWLAIAAKFKKKA